MFQASARRTRSTGATGRAPRGLAAAHAAAPSAAHVPSPLGSGRHAAGSSLRTSMGCTSAPAAARGRPSRPSRRRRLPRLRRPHIARGSPRVDGCRQPVWLAASATAPEATPTSTLPRSIRSLRLAASGAAACSSRTWSFSARMFRALATSRPRGARRRRRAARRRLLADGLSGFRFVRPPTRPACRSRSSTAAARAPTIWPTQDRRRRGVHADSRCGHERLNQGMCGFRLQPEGCGCREICGSLHTAFRLKAEATKN